MIICDDTLASFDVFDTLLTRRVSPPEAIFLIIGQRIAARGLVPLTGEVFARARIEAEHRTRSVVPGGEPTLEQIYRELAWAAELPPEILMVLVAEELATEEEVILPISGAVERVARERTAGRRIAFLSDMYLSAGFIGTQLRKYELMADDDLLLVSCEHGVNKRTGLFEKLFKAAGVRPDQVHHVGNHMGPDVVAPRRTGARATLFDKANPNRYETILADHRWATGGASAILAGASRLARLRVSAVDGHSRAIRDVAASVAAPLLTCYVVWLLRTAAKMGLRRLCFVSRDGQILLELAARLAKPLGVECKLHYLFGSRHAWHLSSVTELTEAEYTWIFEPANFLSVRSQLDRVGLNPDAYHSSLQAAGFSTSEMDRNLSPAKRNRLREWIQTESVQPAILAEAARQRELVLTYLRQEEVLTPEPWGVVDVGWRGRLLRSLATLVAVGGGTAPTGFYLGLLEDNPIDSLTRLAYLGDRAAGFGLVEDVRRIALPVEVFCAADHGTVLGYERTENRVRPVLQKSVDSTPEKWGLPILQDTIKAFADEVSNLPLSIVWQADMRRTLLDVVQAFWQNPTQDEAAAWGQFPFEADQTQVNCLPIVKPYSMAYLPQAVFHGQLANPHTPFWTQGATACTPWPIRKLLEAAMSARQHTARIWHSVTCKPT